jgi:hypothetical protein
MTTERLAACRCGALTATCIGEPVRNSVCHCLFCKQRSGSAFSWNATFAASQVQLHGPHHTYLRYNDEGKSASFHFCTTCGGTVSYEIELRPDMITIPVGTFADPNFPPPEVEVYGSRRNAWCELALPDARQE